MDKKRYAMMLDKLSKLLKDNSEEEYERALFPSRENWPEFERLVQYNLSVMELVKQHEDSEKRFEIMKSMITKLKNERRYDPMFDDLKPDSHKEAKKAANVGPSLENFRANRGSKDIEKQIDSLCQMYAFSYEKACRAYIRPLAQFTVKNKLESCGSAIRAMIAYEAETAFVLEPFNSQIRNSIDHHDWYYDHSKKAIIFEDRGKDPIEMDVDTLRIICEFQMLSHVCMSAAINHFKVPLWKGILVESKKVVKYCDMLKIDHDALLRKYLPIGYSLVQINMLLEKRLGIH